MQYYTFRLDKASSILCTIITPFGKFRSTSFPMGVCQSSDFAQATMEEVLKDIPDVTIYIDDIKITSSTWTQHLATLDKVLTTLQANGFTVNPDKCQWCVQETDFLGFWFTPTGVKPWRKKIDAILAMSPPTRNLSLLKISCYSILIPTTLLISTLTLLLSNLAAF